MIDIKVEVKVEDESLYPDGFKPAKPGDVGIDLRAQMDIEIGPGECKPVKTGIYLNIDHAHAFAMVLPRSGLGAKEGLILGNTAGVIDTQYQGEVICFMWNRNEQETGKTVKISRGDRFAQMLFLPALRPQFQVVDEFSKVTERGAGGFGSTGKG